MKQYLQITFAVCVLNLACAMAFAQSSDVQVPFHMLPSVVQNRFADEVPDLSKARDARVYMGILNGKVVYTGRILRNDGSTETVNVSERGDLIESHKFPAALPPLPQ